MKNCVLTIKVRVNVKSNVCNILFCESSYKKQEKAYLLQLCVREYCLRKLK